MAMNRIWPVAIASVALLLGGCAIQPVIPLKPGVSKPVTGDLPAAIAYVDGTRDKYREAIVEQMNSNAFVTNALIGTGVLIAGLAVGHAHRDAILGASLLGATTYTVGNMNLPRYRLLAYQGGIEALNCARRVVIPFNMEGGDAAAFRQKIIALERSRNALAVAMQALQVQRDAAPASLKDDPSLQAASDVLEAAGKVRQNADSALNAAREFNGASAKAAGELVSAVDRIDAAVVRILIEATPDLSAVLKQIGGLPGLLGSFAPGAGLDDTVTKALAAYAAKPPAAKGLVPFKDTLADATRAVQLAAQETAALSLEVNAYLSGRIATVAEDAFKDCGVAQVVTALAASPASLTFTAGVDGRRVIDLSGGVKPYFVEVDGDTVDGLSVKAPVRFDSRVEVSIQGSKVKTPREVGLRISDSSPTAKVVTAVVTIKAAAAEPKTGAGDAAGGEKKGTGAAAPGNTPKKPVTPPRTGGTAPTALASAVTALGKKGSFKVSGQNIILARVVASADAKAIEATVQCPTDPNPKAKRIDAEAAMLAEIGVMTKPPARPYAVVFLPAGSPCFSD